MQLSAIYQSIQKDLAEVEAQFRLLAESEWTAFPDFYRMLSHVLVGGKTIRPALALLSGKFYNYNFSTLLPMATACELMHIATLVHDDAVDKSDVRRWQPTVNKVWGEDKAILFGDYLFARAGGFAADTQNLRVVKLFTQTLSIISQGELKQSFDAFNLEQTHEHYFQRISSKTASLFLLATESGAILSQAPEESVGVLKEYGYNLGIAFQIVDDILDFVGTEEEMGKPIGSDLTQGTLTLPAMLLLERYPEDNPVKRVFQGEDKQKNIKLAIELVCNSSIAQECYKVASEYCSKACHSLNLLPDSPSHQALVELTDYIITRKR